MKAVATCLLLAVVLWTSACGNTEQPPNAQNDAGGVWQAALTGGTGTSSGFSFITEFTVGGGNGSLSVTNFQFINNVSACFPVTGAKPNGTLVITFNAADQISGTFTFTVTDNGNTLSLTSTSVGGTLSGSSITGGTITGNWTLQGSGSGCSNTSGQFTMTQSTATNATS